MKPARAKSPTPAPSAVATVPELLTAQAASCALAAKPGISRRAANAVLIAAIAALLLKMTEAAEMAAAEAGAGAVRRKDGKRPYALPWPVKRALRGVSGARITAKLN